MGTKNKKINDMCRELFNHFMNSESRSFSEKCYFQEWIEEASEKQIKLKYYEIFEVSQENL